MRWLLACVLALGLTGLCTAQSDVSCQPNPAQDIGPGSLAANASDLSLGVRATATSLNVGSCDVWRLSPDVLKTACPTPDSWLVVELYRMISGAQGQDGTDQAGVYLMAARGAGAPMVTYNSQSGDTYAPAQNPGVFLSTPSPSDPGGNAGTFVDLPAVTYLRSYHRLLVPNVTHNVNSEPWYITVANIPQQASNPFVRALQSYGLRLTCARPADVPCPRPVFTTGPCNSNTVNQCVQVTAGDPRTKQCQCAGASGDFGCQRTVTPINSPGGGDNTIVLQPGQWQYYKVQVPVPPSAQAPANQALLVEFVRSSDSGSGADPVLMVKPVNTQDRNVPSYPDFQGSGDWNSWRLQQRYHYRMVRSFQTSTSGQAEFYLAVLNNNVLAPKLGGLGYTLGGGSRGFQTGGVLKGAITARWMTQNTPFACPQDCNNAGVCIDPKGSSASWSASSIVTVDASLGFVCACNPGYGGLVCEAEVLRVPVTMYGQEARGLLGPGQWGYLQLPIDPRRFNVRSDDLMIVWNAQDLTGQPPSALTNALMTFDEDQYPLQAVPASPKAYRAGVMTVFADAASNRRQTMTYSGSSLLSGASYIVGIYNSDYTRSIPFAYSVSVGIPTQTSSWLRPYMSIVLGITAAIVLCLMMTLCKRMIVRHQWGGWGQRGMLVDPVTGVPTTRMVQIMQRHPGVPAHIVQQFPTFEYVTPAKGAGNDAGAGAGGVAGKDRVTTLASRSQREALQVAAAEAATHAAAAVRVMATQPPHAASPAADPVAAGTETDNANGAITSTAAGVGHDGSTAAGVTSPSPAGDGQVRSATPPPPPAPLTEEAAAAMSAAAHAAAAAHLQQHQQQQSAAAAADGVVPLGPPGVKAADLLDGEEEPSCTVCLCEYEEGDAMRRLPCGHEFHRACIDKWMTQHTTCPICREPLVSPEELAALQEQARASSVAVIYIPQAGAGQAAAANTDNNNAAGGTGAVAAGAAGAGQPQGVFQRMRQALRIGRPRQQARVAAAGVAEQQMAAVQPQQAQQQWQTPGWHVTMAWGSTNAGGDPFASPLPMNSGYGRTGSGRRVARQLSNGGGGGEGHQSVGLGHAPSAGRRSRPLAVAAVPPTV